MDAELSKPTADELREILRLHGMWLRREKGGRRADLQYNILCNVDLKGANLNCANLRFVFLRNADLSGASLQGADLSGSFLIRTNLSGADLSGALLCDALLSFTNNLSDVCLENADLSGSNMEKVNLDSESPSAPLCSDNPAIITVVPTGACRCICIDQSIGSTPSFSGRPDGMPNSVYKKLVEILIAPRRHRGDYRRHLNTLRRFVAVKSLREVGNGNGGGPSRDINELQHYLGGVTLYYTEVDEKNVERSKPSAVAIGIIEWLGQHPELL